MPGRSYQSSTGYRYGMNGQEKDDEIANGIYTAEYWEYDSRLGRRWNLDPIRKSWESGYSTFANNPIVYSDPNGEEEKNQKDANAKKDVKDGDTYTDKNGRNFQYNGGNGGWLEQEAGALNSGSHSGGSSSPTSIVTGGNTVDNGAVTPDFFSTHDFVFDMSANVNFNAGLKFGEEVNVLGRKSKIGLEISAAKIELLSASVKAADPFNPDSYGYGYAGKGGYTKITQKASLGIGILEITGENAFEQNLMSEYSSPQNEKSNWYVSTIFKQTPLLSKQTKDDIANKIGSEVMKHVMSEPKIKVSGKTNSSDYLIEGKVGAGLILGVEFKFNVGYKTK